MGGKQIWFFRNLYRLLFWKTKTKNKLEFVTFIDPMLFDQFIKRKLITKANQLGLAGKTVLEDIAKDDCIWFKIQ